MLRGPRIATALATLVVVFQLTSVSTLAAATSPQSRTPLAVWSAPYRGHTFNGVHTAFNPCKPHAVIDRPSFNKTNGAESLAVLARANSSACSPKGPTSYYYAEPVFTSKPFLGIAGARQIVWSWNGSGMTNLTTSGNGSWTYVSVSVGFADACVITNGTVSSCATTCAYSDSNWPCTAFQRGSTGNPNTTVSRNSTFTFQARAFLNTSLSSSITYELVFGLLVQVEASSGLAPNHASALFWMAPPYGGANLTAIAFY